MRITCCCINQTIDRRCRPLNLSIIGLNLKGVIDPVNQIGQGNDHGQLNNFIFRIIPADIFQNVGINRGGAPGNNIRQADGDFFLCIECIAALIKSQGLNLFVGDAGLLRRSSVVVESVAAIIDAGSF